MWSTVCAASRTGIEGMQIEPGHPRAAAGSMRNALSGSAYFFAYFTGQPYGFDVFVSTGFPAIAASRQAAT